MMAVWALCLFAAAPLEDTTAPPPPEPVSHLIPESLTRLLTQRPELQAIHQGYLKDLAQYPDLAAAETAWWKASTTPALRQVAAQFEDALANSDTAQHRFQVFYEAMASKPALRTAVEALVQTEMEQSRANPGVSRALEFLRANPDIALRFLRDPVRVRPIPAPLADAYRFFETHDGWSEALLKAYETLTQMPDAHLIVFPWWRELASLITAEKGDRASLGTELYRNPHYYWLWHLRNVNLVGNAQAAPWIRYWQRLVQRDDALARTYGPFLSRLLDDPELLRQHLADLQASGTPADAAWPPAADPPPLPPREIRNPAEDMKRRINRPVVPRPERPEVARPPRPDRPESPARPTAPRRTGG